LYAITGRISSLTWLPAHPRSASPGHFKALSADKDGIDPVHEGFHLLPVRRGAPVVFATWTFDHAVEADSQAEDYASHGQ
jgi:hypothetical protein